MRKFKLAKYMHYGFILLFLFHFESISIGAIKVSYILKTLLLLYLVFKILIRKNKNYSIYKPLLWLSLLQIVNLELLINPLNAIFLFATVLLLPLLGIFSLEYSFEQLKKVLLFFASFFILSFVPYQLGILKSLNSGYDLLGYGSDIGGLIGPFHTVHSASAALAGSFLVIVFFLFTKAFNRIYLLVLLILSFYLIIFLFVRTGIAMITIGCLPMLFHFANKNWKMRFSIILFAFLFVFLISSWVLSNDLVLKRFTGQRINSSETESFENLGSGRGRIYIYSLQIYSEANFFEKIIGVGSTQSSLRMESKLGQRLFPHNGFLVLLLNNGIIGLILFLAFLIKVLKSQRFLSKDNQFFIRSLMLAYLTMTFFQNYDILYMYLILVIGIGMTYKEGKLVVRKQINGIYV